VAASIVDISDSGKVQIDFSEAVAPIQNQSLLQSDMTLSIRMLTLDRTGLLAYWEIEEVTTNGMTL